MVMSERELHRDPGWGIPHIRYRSGWPRESGAAGLFHQSHEDAPPELSLQRPGAIREVMPLEEVVLEVDASDDY